MSYIKNSRDIIHMLVDTTLYSVPGSLSAREAEDTTVNYRDISLRVVVFGGKT